MNNPCILIYVRFIVSFLTIVNEKNATICEKELTAKDINLFRYAVVNNYWYQMFLGK